MSTLEECFPAGEIMFGCQIAPRGKARYSPRKKNLSKSTVEIFREERILGSHLLLPVLSPRE
jgi:hypothetical protein